MKNKKQTDKVKRKNKKGFIIAFMLFFILLLISDFLNFPEYFGVKKGILSMIGTFGAIIGFLAFKVQNTSTV